MGQLFDFSFSQFVTKSFVRVLYAIALVGGAAAALLAFNEIRAEISLLPALLSIPVVFLVVALLARVWAEMTIVLFRIAENTGETAAHTAKLTGRERSPSPHEVR